MENLVFVASIILFFGFVFIQGKLSERKERAWLWKKMESSYGQKPEKEIKIERFDKLDGYYKAHRKDGQIDDITWHDLSMDEVFKRVDYTKSGIGEEYLYYMLRTPLSTSEDIGVIQKVCDYFDRQPDERIRVQYLFHKLGNTGKYSLYEYIAYLDNLSDLSNVKEILKNLLYPAFILLMFVKFEVGLTLLLGLMLWQLRTYFKQKRIIEPYITSIVYVLRMLDTAKELEKTELPECMDIKSKLHFCRKELEKGRSLHFLFLYPGGKTGNGNPLDIVLDYIRMLFHIDIIVFRHVVKQMHKKADHIDELVTVLGSMDAMLSIGMYRASLQGKWCAPVLGEEMSVSIEEVYHPLLDEAVCNSIHAKRGVLLTGSNASGKSTFLKSVAISALFAQTIGVVCAKSYVAPMFSIYSSMALSDNIQLKDSYYMAEIKSIKRIMDAVDKSKYPTIVFVDEVLRGTNTVERIAASTQILRRFSESNTICFAATHDVELTHLLEDAYDNYHFEEQVAGEDISFSYLLMNGRATTRNAIKLLSIMGYEDAVVEKAQEMAELFLQTGQWKSTLT